jgi:hypothetical protein
MKQILLLFELEDVGSVPDTGRISRRHKVLRDPHIILRSGHRNISPSISRSERESDNLFEPAVRLRMSPVRNSTALRQSRRQIYFFLNLLIILFICFTYYLSIITRVWK